MEVVLFRKQFEDFGDDLKQEFLECSKHFDVVEYRSNIPRNSLVIGRYSVLPFYKELERELSQRGSSLINTYTQHNYIADIRNYYLDVVQFTPKTYTVWDNLPQGKYIVKGITNSRKHQWNTHMFAETKEDVPKVVARLFDDQLILNQGVVVREFVPLIKLGEGINGLPISEEYRLFFYGDKYLAGGFYWSNYENADKMKVPRRVVDFGKMIARIVSKHTNFFVIDVGVKDDGDLLMIELNDGQMSGLSMVDPNMLYENLAFQLNVKKLRNIIKEVKCKL